MWEEDIYQEIVKYADKEVTKSPLIGIEGMDVAHMILLKVWSVPYLKACVKNKVGELVRKQQNEQEMLKIAYTWQTGKEPPKYD